MDIGKFILVPVEKYQSLVRAGTARPESTAEEKIAQVGRGSVNTDSFVQPPPGIPATGQFEDIELGGAVFNEPNSRGGGTSDWSKDWVSIKP